MSNRSHPRPQLLTHTQGNSQQGALYSGKWTSEELDYVCAMRREFKEGTLSTPEGTSMRTFMAKTLSCNPKRISKKFECTGYDGRLPHRKMAYDTFTPEELEKRKENLRCLREKYQESRKTVLVGGSNRNTHPAPTKEDLPKRNKVPKLEHVTPVPSKKQIWLDHRHDTKAARLLSSLQTSGVPTRVEDANANSKASLLVRSVLAEHVNEAPLSDSFGGNGSSLSSTSFATTTFHSLMATPEQLQLKAALSRSVLDAEIATLVALRQASDIMATPTFSAAVVAATAPISRALLASASFPGGVPTTPPPSSNDLLAPVLFH